MFSSLREKSTALASAAALLLNSGDPDRNTHGLLETPPVQTRKRRRIRKKQYAGRIIATVKRDGRLHEFHATKGWRSYRAA